MSTVTPFDPYLRHRQVGERAEARCMIRALFKHARRFDRFLVGLGRDGIVTFRDLAALSETELFERHPLEKRKRSEFVKAIEGAGFGFRPAAMPKTYAFSRLQRPGGR